MTTEIAVFNRLGVALATDSAVTITGGGKTKIFNSADKLFELSTSYPVAVMINGNMDCIGVPWEVVIKDFRKENGSSPLDTIEEWLNKFIEFVHTHAGIEEGTVNNYIREIVDDEISHLLLIIDRRVGEKLSADNPRSRRRVDVNDLSNFYIEAINERTSELEEIGAAGSVAGLPDAEIVAKYRNIFDARIKDRFLPYQLEAHEVGLFDNLAVKSIKSNELKDFTTGIVVAGFGANSIYPEVVSIEITGKVLDSLKISDRCTNVVAGGDDAGRVISFAQTDVIDRLLGGADPLFVKSSSEFIESAVRDAASSMEELFRPKRISQSSIKRRQLAVEAIVDVLSKEYVSSTASRLRKKFTQAFDRMVSMMPKQELIELAEALVSITAVERKASSDEGTVGGPIDVAIITKHEGFVWVKRKHHFPAELNPNHFWRKYVMTKNGG